MCFDSPFAHTPSASTPCISITSTEIIFDSNQHTVCHIAHSGEHSNKPLSSNYTFINISLVAALISDCIHNKNIFFSFAGFCFHPTVLVLGYSLSNYYSDWRHFSLSLRLVVCWPNLKSYWGRRLFIQVWNIPVVSSSSASTAKVLTRSLA